MVKRLKQDSAAPYLLDQSQWRLPCGTRTDTSGWPGASRDNEQVSVDLFLTVPRELVADLKVNPGAVEVRDISGTLRIDNDLGSVKISTSGQRLYPADLGSVEILRQTSPTTCRWWLHG